MTEPICKFGKEYHDNYYKKNKLLMKEKACRPEVCNVCGYKCSHQNMTRHKQTIKCRATAQFIANQQHQFKSKFLNNLIAT